MKATPMAELLKAGDTAAAAPYIFAALLLSAVVAGIFGVIIGIPALRLRGDYLAIITLGFGEIIRVILTNIDSVLGFKFTYGAAGLKRIPKFSEFDLVFICVVLCCTLIHMLMKSRHGRAILSIRENEIAAESVGIPTTYYKTLAFVFSAMLAGIAGCLYAGLWECVYSLNGKKLTEKEGEELGLEIMKKLNEYTKKWKEAENIDYSLYGTPLESTTYKFAKCLQNRFGIVKGVTDKNYITNSYHIHVTEPIDAFDKLALEAKFQALSPGGAISYVEVPDMQNNLDAVLGVMEFIYDNIMYAELNTKSDYCQVCGYDGEIEIVDDGDGKLVWECPNCKNRDQSKMNVARRTCGYIGTQYWNQGRTEEIKDRVLHL